LITNFYDLGRDTQSDFVRVIAPEIFADWTEKFLSPIRREAMGDEFAAEHNSFGCASDGPEIRKRALREGALQYGAIAGVAFGHADNEGGLGQRGDQVSRVGVDYGLEVACPGQALEPVGTRVDHGDGARQREQHGH
jgi:hypothetical protein